MAQFTIFYLNLFILFFQEAKQKDKRQREKGIQEISDTIYQEKKKEDKEVKRGGNGVESN